MAGVYIHIPFCKRKCSYCDFYSVANLSNTDDYIQCIVNELNIRKDYLNENAIDSIYFGGGTPSLLNGKQIDVIIRNIKYYFTIKPETEVTLEVNPDDITEDHLSSVKEVGINRISIGIQSFDDNLLKVLGRRHNAAQAERAVYLIKKAGFKNISIDLIYGIPGQNILKWKETLEKAILLDVQHISAYHLTVETGTLLDKWLKSERIKMISEEESEQQFYFLIETLEKAGYEQYEISNFTRGGFYSVHNSAYWKDINYLGLGASAHSYNGNSRQWNVCNIKEYMDSIKNGRFSGNIEILSKTDRYNEYLLLSLRTKWGIDLKILKQQFGFNFYNNLINKAEKYIKSGKLKQNLTQIALTKEGQMISDYILKDLFI